MPVVKKSAGIMSDTILNEERYNTMISFFTRVIIISIIGSFPMHLIEKMVIF
jgi:hypothetical protein